jgi:formylglycine-generating enzyme required for sulfatase activity
MAVAGAGFACGCGLFYPLDGIGCEGSCADAEASVDAASLDASPSDGSLAPSCGSTRGAAMLELPDRGFCIDRTETTTAEYGEFLADDGDKVAGLSDACRSWKTSFTPDDWAKQVGQPRRPVAWVDWCDAEAYCRWAGKRLCGKIGGGATPFTDTANAGSSEWQYACSRGGDPSRVYPYGPELNLTACQAAVEESADVGTKLACVGGFDGILDMSGNVWEWEDACAGPGKDDLCYSRGGSFVHDDNALSCGLFPYDSPRSSRHSDVGIRCCSR